jgi:hypothetical protein
MVSMLRSDLIDVVNSGRAWAFLGAGASIDAGGLSWGGLVDGALERLAPEEAERVRRDTLFTGAIKARQFARAFGAIEKHAGRQALEDATRSSLPTRPNHGSLISRLGDWPFEGYITLNYDGLLETALADQHELGWGSVGNAENELRQLSGGAERVVWHLHGAASLTETQSRLILTERDYDSVYVGETALKQQLRAILGTRRVIFFGFGFRDAEVLRVLKEVGQLADPTRPILAFVSDDIAAAEGGPESLFTRFNIDVVTYTAADGDHGALKQLLHTYSSFIVRRSFRYRRKARVAPSYDPETTGLLIYNELVLKGEETLAEAAFDALLRARILSLLEARGQITSADIGADIAERTRLVQQGQGSLLLVADRVERELTALVEEGLALQHEDAIELTPVGRNAVGVHAGTSERMARQFVTSLRQRAHGLAEPDAGERIALTAESFLKECVRRRSLGIAMVMAARTVEQDFQIVALLQRLPDFLQESNSHEDALALSRLIRDVLADPSDAERTYLGLALQAQFGVHLLSLDPDTLQARLREMSSSAYVIDASTLIPFLARGSAGHLSARRLIEGLAEAGSSIGTTPLLVTEIEEHGRWAAGRVGIDGRANETTLAASLGKAGANSNAFLEGFVAEAGAGALSNPSLFSYFRDVFRLQPKQKYPSEDDVTNTLIREGVESWPLTAWDGFEETMWAERDDVAESIGERRRRRESFTHDRQVKAEAEALLTVRYLREEKFRRSDRNVKAAFFISNTRLIDELAGPGAPITIRPEAVMHLLATLRPVDTAELALFTDGLLSELSERGLSLVDRPRLMRVFGPLVDASQENLESELLKHRELVAQKYGEDATRAYADVDTLEAPLVLLSSQAQRAVLLEEQLATEQERTAALSKAARVSDRDRQELAELRAGEKIKRTLGRGKQRAAQSRRSRKKK